MLKKITTLVLSNKLCYTLQLNPEMIYQTIFTIFCFLVFMVISQSLFLQKKRDYHKMVREWSDGLSSECCLMRWLLPEIKILFYPTFPSFVHIIKNPMYNCIRHKYTTTTPLYPHVMVKNKPPCKLAQHQKLQRLS
jgi:hypothetical protein